MNETTGATFRTEGTFGGDLNLPHGKISLLGGNNLTISGTAADHAGLSFATNAILPCAVSATNTNTVDLGATSEKFKDAHFGGTINAVNVAISGTLSGAGSFVPVGGGEFTGNVTVSGGAGNTLLLKKGTGSAAIALGCLLYTSPSPRDGLLSRMPSSA